MTPRETQHPPETPTLNQPSLDLGIADMPVVSHARVRPNQGRRRTPRRSPVGRAGDRVPRGITGRLKGWLDLDGEFFVGPRYIRLLEGIERTGTIRAGCRETGMSYRTCRNRIKRMEAVLGSPLVLTTRGGDIRGRSTLTPAARQLIRIYRRWRGDVERVSRRAFARALETAR